MQRVLTRKRPQVLALIQAKEDDIHSEEDEHAEEPSTRVNNESARASYDAHDSDRKIASTRGHNEIVEGDDDENS